MENELKQEKAIIRSILMAMGGRVSVQDFLLEYKKNIGMDFKTVLNEFKMGFGDFMNSIPDVVNCVKSGSTIFIEQVSSAANKHMEHFTKAVPKSK